MCYKHKFYYLVNRNTQYLMPAGYQFVVIYLMNKIARIAGTLIRTCAHEILSFPRKWQKHLFELINV